MQPELRSRPAVQRWLTLVGRAWPATLRSRIDLAQILLCGALAVESVVALTRPLGPSSGLFVELAIAVGLFGGSLHRRTRRLAALALPVFLLVRIGAAFPVAPNHWYVGLVFGSILAYAAAVPYPGGIVGFCLLRWLLVAVTFGSGVQKLLHGQYFQGEYFTYLAVRDEHFRAVLGLLGAAPDAEPLGAALDAGLEVGLQPTSAIVPVLSQLVLWLEIALPLGLLWSRTRPLCVVALIPFFLGVEAVTLEYGFVGTMLALVATHVPPSRSAPYVVLCLVSVLAGGAGYAVLR